MKPPESILTSGEVQLCLVLQALIQELVVLTEQMEVLDNRHKVNLLLRYKKFNL